MPSSIGDITLDTKDVLQDQGATIVLRLTRTKEWSIRLAIAKWLFRLGAWIAWVDIEFEDDSTERLQ